MDGFVEWNIPSAVVLQRPFSERGYGYSKRTVFQMTSNTMQKQSLKGASEVRGVIPVVHKCCLTANSVKKVRDMMPVMQMHILSGYQRPVGDHMEQAIQEAPVRVLTFTVNICRHGTCHPGGSLLLKSGAVSSVAWKSFS
jgi:hypothetical protein